MDTFSAFMMGQANKNQPVMVFDWDKAAKLIRNEQPKEAFAGLEDDLEYTEGIIWKDGMPVKDDYTYLASTWARPLLIMDGVPCECWRYEQETPGWNADTKWPKSALEILSSKEV